MSWTTLTKRAIGYLITKANDVDLWIDDIHYLKGQAGPVEMESGILSDTDIADDLGSETKRWANIHGGRVFGNRARVSYEIREMRETWPAGASFQHNIDIANGGSVLAGGSGQIVLKVDNETVNSRARVYQQTEQNGALGNQWDRGKKCYFRLEFSLDVNDSRTRVFIGFRQTPGTLIPAPAAEHYLGLEWDGTNWKMVTANAVSEAVTNVTVAAGGRHVVEVWAEGATAAEVWVDGVLVARKTTNLPAADMEWEFNLYSTGGGAADDSHLTIGQMIVQERLT